MPTNVPLRETAVITLNGAGAGTARVGPLSAREIWHPTVAAVKANAVPVLEAQCNIYVGLSASAENFRDGCVDGSSGDSTGNVSGDTVPRGQYIFAVWTGGDANVQATLTVTGTKDV